MTPDGKSIELREIFLGQEAKLIAELRTGTHAGHSGVQGDGTEQHWLDILDKRLPRRYAASRAIVVDSDGQCSDQIDLVIYDRQYSPLLWESGSSNYVPAESVYAVFEIKPEASREYVLYAADKVASVRRLKRTSSNFGWAQGTMSARQDFVPLGGILTTKSGWSPAFGDPFKTALRDANPDGHLDLGCILGEGAFDVPDRAVPDDYTVGDPDLSLVTFQLNLLERLKTLGTAPAIDYPAYLAKVSGS